MTLTVVVGSSGSGKTTFLNDVHKINKCTYIRQVCKLALALSLKAWHSSSLRAARENKDMAMH